MSEAERARLDARWDTAGALGRLLGCIQVILTYQDSGSIPSTLIDRLKVLYDDYALHDAAIHIQQRLDHSA
jgi:hypothetical protein